MNPNQNFENIALNYNDVLNKSLALTGEDAFFYARKRIFYFSNFLQQIKYETHKVLDFGFGDAKSLAIFTEQIRKINYVGVEESKKFVELARVKYTINDYQFLHLKEFTPDSSFDIAYCNGVFHHIKPLLWQTNINLIYQSLKKGGYFSFWENNPYNPFTRFIMSRTEFDKDAVLLYPHRSIKLLKNAGFEIILLKYFFIFPGFLKFLRPLEKYFARLPLGGQYQIIVKK